MTRTAVAFAVVVALVAAPRVAHADGAATTTEQDEDYVMVKGSTWGSPRGIGDVRIKRELLDAAPRQQTSEMLSAAPGFFVDHEDGEGLGNDVYLRGFDLSHGAGIEMRLGAIPLNIPLHVQGQGYVDANFIIPEVVRSIRVLSGPYDPRQGDAAIVGSAYFDVGVPERGYHLKTSVGSFTQGRAVAIAAPRDMDDETFAAVAVRSTDGFGTGRASKSATAMTQYAVDLGPNDRLKVTATAYGTHAQLAGVVRRDDVDAGRIGFEGRYPSLAGGQGVGTMRVVASADYDRRTGSGHLEIAPWAMWTNFVVRQNFTGNLEIGRQNPSLFGLGDLYATRNREGAVGFTARHHSNGHRLGDVAVVAIEPGVSLRAGHTEQGKSLLRSDTLATWDRRLDLGLETLDAGAWIDLDARVLKDIHLSFGPRADVLAVSVFDKLARKTRSTTGVVAGPRATLAYEAVPELVPLLSYGEGFRSVNADRLTDGGQPYSKVRSFEVGLRSSTRRERFVATAAAFETHVENELVFEAQSGGLETQKASVRRGVVTSLLARPASWLILSSAFSVTRGEFTTLAPGIAHYVPSIPSVLFRTDATARGTVARLEGHPMTGRLGVGYTLLGGRHLTDDLLGATQNILNATAGVRWMGVELGLDCYNLIGLRYPDDEQVYASNWTTAPRATVTSQARASIARHISAAPPRTILGSVTLYF